MINYKGFSEKNPYVKKIYNSAMKRAKEVGYVRTLLGRRRHFDLWESAEWSAESYPVPRKRALELYGPDIVRAYIYKALNAIIQGSAADMTKAAMNKVYKELGFIPHMQVHDELNYSVDCKEDAMRIKTCMETAIDLRVPMYVDLDLGKSWK